MKKYLIALLLLILLGCANSNKQERDDFLKSYGFNVICHIGYWDMHSNSFAAVEKDGKYYIASITRHPNIRELEEITCCKKD